MKIKKRNGTFVPYNEDKIRNAICKAGKVGPATLDKILIRIRVTLEHLDRFGTEITVEYIQNLVEKELLATRYKDVAVEYIRYRTAKSTIREQSKTISSVLDLIDDKNSYLKTENSNKNISIASTQRDYMAGEVSKTISRSLLIPKEIMDAHDNGAIHFHDLDYFAQHMFNCCLVNLEDMLQNGTVINGTRIEKPHSFMTACTIATQIAAIVASNQFGGQTMSLTHLAPFVDVSRQKIRKKLISLYGGERPENLDELVEDEVKEEIKKGVQTLQYQILTIMSTNGQTPFITLFMYLGEAKDERTKKDLALIIEEVLKQRMQGVKNESGAWITPAFPKLVYVLEPDNISEDSDYWGLTVLAAHCTAKRMVPDYISEKKMLELKGYCFPCMGCRSFLAPWFDKDGTPKFYGRFNQGVVTLNLPYAALEAYDEVANNTSSNKETEDTVREELLIAFFKKLNHYLDLCHQALQIRHRRLLNTDVGISPMHWQHGAISRLPVGSTFNELLFGGYSSISLGYAGLYEAVHVLTGKSHTKSGAKGVARQILMHLNDACNKWREEENIGYSVYGTPIESTTYKFAKALKDTFGEIPEVSDHDYITNSYHVNVREEIDPFEKLDLEAKFQELSQGGCISYIECSDLQHNISAVLEVLKHIYEKIMYAELNIKSDYCRACNYEGEMMIESDDKKLIWRCPNCGNTNQKLMNVARRTCGYVGTQFWNQGRTAEIKDRYVHLGQSQTIADFSNECSENL